MALAVVVLGAGIGLSVQTLSTEKKFERIAGSIETEVRKAAMSAAMQRKDVYLTVFKKEVRGVQETLKLGDARLSLVQAGRFSSWTTPPANGYRWKFAANGLIEPLSLKLAFPEGEISMDFDPLTGISRNKTMMIYE